MSASERQRKFSTGEDGVHSGGGIDARTVPGLRGHGLDQPGWLAFDPSTIRPSAPRLAPDLTGRDETAPISEEEALRDLLKRCSPGAREAAVQFRRTRELDWLPVIVVGVIERYVERDLRPRMQSNPDDVRLIEDLAIDSLTMLEIIMLAEEVLQISIANEELVHLRTLGEVQRFMRHKVQGLPASIATT